MEQVRDTVLLIDDDPFFLKVMGDAFTQGGFDVVTANSGDEGIIAFVKHQPAVVVSDLIMPGKGGVGTCLEITRLAGERQPIMILLTSMFDEPPHRHAIPEMGASVHIPKSTPPPDVVAIVGQLLKRARGAVAPA